MTPEAQRITIAEACGYYKVGASNCWSWKLNGEDIGTGDFALPDYLNDLNAMHEAEKILSGKQNFHYQRLVAVIHSGIPIESHLLGEPSHFPFKLSLAAIDSTAAQRAEAFLRTIGKWEGA